MAKQEPQQQENLPPVFINSQVSPVSVYDPDRRRVDVFPFDWRRRHANEGVRFAVEGEHYRQFVHPHGPLTFLTPDLHGQEVYDTLTENLEDHRRLRALAKEREAAARKNAPAGGAVTMAEDRRAVTHVRVDAPPVTLPVAIADQLTLDAFPGASQVELQDINAHLAARVKGDRAPVPTHLVRFEDKIEEILKTKPSEGPADDPLNPKGDATDKAPPADPPPAPPLDAPPTGSAATTTPPPAANAPKGGSAPHAGPKGGGHGRGR